MDAKTAGRLKCRHGVCAGLDKPKEQRKEYQSSSREITRRDHSFWCELHAKCIKCWAHAVQVSRVLDGRLGICPEARSLAASQLARAVRQQLGQPASPT